MKTQYYTATSLDGFITTEDDSLDWLFPLGDLNETGYLTFIEAVGALTMGSVTYEWILRHTDEVAAQRPSSHAARNRSTSVPSRNRYGTARIFAT